MGSSSLTPAVPDPTTASIEALHDVCFAVRVWADDCDDIAAATEMLARVSAVEAYLSRRNAEAPAQEAARWLEVRIGDLLGPANETNGRPLSRDKEVIAQFDRFAFRRLAEHRELVAALVPCSRSAILRAIKQAAACDPSTRPRLDNSPSDGGLPGLNGMFGAIVADPPWQYDNKATRNAAANHYPTMTIDELCALDVQAHAADQSHLYLWTTNGFLREAFDVLDAWGFTYKAHLAWVKPQMGMGNYFRISHEHVLFGVRGGLRTRQRDLMSWFQAPRSQHSRKPEQFLDLVERASPGDYLEMFARRARMGWKHWGNEA